MKIGVDIRSLMDKNYSGVSWCTLFLLREILVQDRVNEYILYYNSGRDISAQLPKLEQDNVKIVATHYPNKLFNYFLQKILQWPKIDQLLIAPLLSRACPELVEGRGLGVVKISEDVDGLDIFWSPHLNFISLSKKTKHILTIHDLSFLLTPEFFSIRKNIWHKVLNAKKMIASADVVVAISENTKRDIVRLTGIDENKIKVIYDGIGDDFYPFRNSPDAETAARLIAIKNKYNLPDKFILYLGTIEPRKNIASLISAFEQLADKPEMREFQLLIVGYSGWKNKEVYQAINSSKHKDRIKLIGYIENSEKIYYYNLCTIFCYPSLYEGFGLPVLEAMACGAPVVTSNLSSMPEVAGDSAILIDPMDENSIKQGIMALAGDDKLRELYSAKGIERAKLFGWKKSAEEYLKIFNS
jgi:glycosyltransferase involved in cell wall biosynthesis